MPQCPNCGSQASGKFCPNCGAQIPDQAAAAAVPPQPQPQQYVQQPQPPMPPQGYQPQGYPPQFPPQPGYQMPPKKKGLGVFGWISIITGVIAVIIVALVALGGGSSTGGPAVSTPVITTSWQEGQKLPPSLTTVPANSEFIYAVVDTHYDKPTEVTAKWYLEGEHAADLDTTETVTQDQNELAFHLTTKSGFPTGAYKVEIWVAGAKMAEKAFTVK